MKGDENKIIEKIIYHKNDIMRIKKLERMETEENSYRILANMTNMIRSCRSRINNRTNKLRDLVKRKVHKWKIREIEIKLLNEQT